MTSGVVPRWNRSARAAIIAAIVWAAAWDPARASAQGPGGVAAPRLFPVPKTSPPNQGEYLLRPVAGGGYVYDDNQFVARVAPDGHVTFTDKHIRFEVRVFGVLTDKYRRAGDNRPSLIQALEQVVRGDPDRPTSPLLEVCTQPVDMRLSGMAPCVLALTPISITGTFDLSDEMLRMTGQGWHKYEKAKFLSATFDFRVRLAAARQARLLREALADIPDRLDGLWRDPTFTPRERRRIMCLLWAEVNVEDAASRRAADVMLRWIGQKLPEGSTDGFTASETAACTDISLRPFDPYSDPLSR